ncbi:GTPase Era [Canibacter sp. lx-72]|uniref:GTPase Era n=1 Tax=Canibacter zhuwentaonis TaxID=2837491 RepID=UPI001BDCC505|nr:GTPase Era [Canibacter zhuwentaonis]MBT1017891.1 GTPase Era [Canibacter zhuwentaonis]
MLDKHLQNLDFRAGFVSFVGRPNVGKSTLTNALVGQKIAITSSKPQTTRRAIRGIVHRDSGQLIIVDTPGIHRPRKLIGKRLNSLVQNTLSDVDVIGMCFPANERIGPGDRFIFEQLERLKNAKKIAIVTKIDRASKSQIFERLQEVNELGEWAEIIPVSAVSGEQLEILVSLLLKLMPLSPQLYQSTVVTEEGEHERIAEIIRESALENAREELPHSLAVSVEDAVESDTGLLHVYATIFVERASQKAIVIGHKGSRISQIGRDSKPQIEEIIGRKIYLVLHVKVLKEWQNDPKMLTRLGF